VPKQPQSHRFGRRTAKRIAHRGLRPRDAASLIVVLWVFFVVVFGVVEHLVDPDTYNTVWLGMWWG
jgi:hypothetical protein